MASSCTYHIALSPALATSMRASCQLPAGHSRRPAALQSSMLKHALAQRQAVTSSSRPCSRRRAAVLCVLKESQELAMGTRAPDFALLEPLTQRQWTLSDFEGHPALLVAFICNHCPYVVHVRDKFVEVAREFVTGQGLGVVAISSNSVTTHPQDGPEEMAKLARQLDMPFPYLYDETQEVAKAYKAACTPDFYIFRKEGRRPFELAYHGQFDDSRPRNNKPVTGSDLRVALQHILSSRPFTYPQKPSIGCNIKWTPGNEPIYF